MLVHLQTLGCRLNEAELETWAQDFERAGHQLTQHLEAAHLIVLNSCAVTSDAARKSRQSIRRIHRANPQAKLVVSGCYATLNRDQAQAEFGVDLIIGNQDKNRLVEKSLADLNLESMPAQATEPGEFSLFALGRQRAFVKVQDGCRYRCTFCIVTVARGEESSRPIAAVIDEINALHRQGIQEVVLTGVHLGGYGSDLNCNLADLINAILAETDIPRIRLGSLEPWELNDDFFAVFTNRRLMPHLHLPLQSGSDSVLRRMARRCKTQEFSAIVDQFRGQNPCFNVTTDIIVGFPGETDSEWQESLDFISATGFGHIHIFTYSRREGTKAATLPGQIRNAVKKQRSTELHYLAQQMKADFYNANLGASAPILWEGYDEPCGDNQKRVFGYTPNYLKVACIVESERNVANQLIEAQLVDATPNWIEGKISELPHGGGI